MRLGIVLLPFLLLGCGYDGGYRYECQDPANWGAEDCLPPKCKVSGTCTTDILGFDPASGEMPEDAIPLIPETTVAP